MPQAFTTLTVICAPLPQDNVNTDDIYPAPGASPLAQSRGAAVGQRLQQLALNAFAAWRWQADGSPRPEFVLNRPPYDQARILVAGANFGCGSSREAAVWCLAEIGIRCVIAPSFGDIFYTNCFKNGLLAIRLAPEVVARLMTVAQGDSPELTVDLAQQTVRSPDGRVDAFELDAYKRHCLLNGLDEIGATLARLPEIEAFEARYLSRRPWLRASGGAGH